MGDYVVELVRLGNLKNAAEKARAGKPEYNPDSADRDSQSSLMFSYHLLTGKSLWDVCDIYCFGKGFYEIAGELAGQDCSKLEDEIKAIAVENSESKNQARKLIKLANASIKPDSKIANWLGKNLENIYTLFSDNYFTVSDSFSLENGVARLHNEQPGFNNSIISAGCYNSIKDQVIYREKVAEFRAALMHAYCTHIDNLQLSDHKRRAVRDFGDFTVAEGIEAFKEIFEEIVINHEKAHKFLIDAASEHEDISRFASKALLADPTISEFLADMRMVRWIESLEPKEKQNAKKVMGIKIAFDMVGEYLRHHPVLIRYAQEEDGFSELEKIEKEITASFLQKPGLLEKINKNLV